MNFPSDASWFFLNGTRTVRVVSMSDGTTFNAVFKLDGETFNKFTVKLARIDAHADHRMYLTRNRLFELITSSTGVDTIPWRKKDFENYFSVKPTYLTIHCREMDKYGKVLADVGEFAETLVNEKLAFKL